jgi:hypothetical protein
MLQKIVFQKGIVIKIQIRFEDHAWIKNFLLTFRFYSFFIFGKVE